MVKVSCVGLAIGSGIYFPGIIATIVFYFILKDVFNLDKRKDSRINIKNDHKLEVILSDKENEGI